MAALASLKRTPAPVDLEFNSNRLSYRHVTSLKIHIEFKALSPEKGELAAALTSLKTTPTPVDLEFNSNRLSYRHGTRLKIHIKLSELNCCQYRIRSCSHMIKNHPLIL